MNDLHLDSLTKAQLEKIKNTIIITLIIQVLVGILLLSFPLIGLTFIIYFIIFLIIFFGVTKIYTSLTEKEHYPHWILRTVYGVVLVVWGIYAIGNIAITAGILGIYLAFFLIIEAIMLFAQAKHMSSTGFAYFNAAITLAFGLYILFTWPTSVLIIPFFIGFSFIFNAIDEVFILITVNKFIKKFA